MLGAIIELMRSPGPGLAANEVGLAEHAVQVQVEAGEVVARAETEARRQDADIAVRVDADEVRRVAVCVDGQVERLDERDDVRVRRQRGERVGHSREPGTRQEPRPGERDLDRLAPPRAVRLEIPARDRAAALGAELKNASAIVPE